MTTTLVFIFAIGYCAIAFEKLTKINKAAASLLTGVACWTVYGAFSPDKHFVAEQLIKQVGDLSGILFFLMGAMTIVEMMDSYNGFRFITDRITTKSKRFLLWTLGIVAFFLSAILDNLTTTVVMTSLLCKLVANREERLLFTGIIVIAANAGGAWTPIGDVTTTMLWIGGRLSSLPIMYSLFIPSLLCLLVPITILSFSMKGAFNAPAMSGAPSENGINAFHRNVVFFTGLGVLVFVPVFKAITYLPPYMGILFGLGILWVITEMMHLKEKREEYSVSRALQNIDMPSILFFLGILLAVAALQAAEILPRLAAYVDACIDNKNILLLFVGLLSSVIDNVPLVAAVMNMYDLSAFPADHRFWMLLSYCAGTGGSCLIIGSAAGIAAMGLVKIDFIWYFRRIAPLALIGYFAGAAWFIFVR